MNFDVAINSVATVLKNIGTTINPKDYDGLIVKKIVSSNSLDEGRTTNQTHIAITGPQMDMFPYLCADGYFYKDGALVDADLKKYFVISVPLTLFESNCAHLGCGKGTISFSNGKKNSTTCVVRSKREGQTDQLQVSMLNMDGPDFVEFRKNLHTGAYFVLLKLKKQMRYHAFGINPQDSKQEEALSKLNNLFFKDSSTTVVSAESFNNAVLQNDQVITWHEEEIDESEYIAFRGMLAFFVDQLNINNGIKTGTPQYVNSNTPKSRSLLAPWNHFKGFELSCRFGRGYQKKQSNANYLNYMWVNINPQIDPSTKEVQSLCVYTKPEGEAIFTGKQHTILDLDLFSQNQPNEELKEFFSELREEIYKWQIGAYDSESNIDDEFEKEWSEQGIRQRNYKMPLNCILYGAPGTGKTYSTAQYALAIAEDKDLDEIKKEKRSEIMDRYRALVENGQIVFTTFHQSYSYEDFIQGIKPDTSGEKISFKPVDGVFKKIADIASDTPEKDFIIIIDEINRANISKVFGELITLIEEDKRLGRENEISVTLPLGDKFAVPQNLFIVGTMNSADKSISLIDTALRRRFEFIEYKPDEELVSDTKLREVLHKLNEGLAKELSSPDLLIGHSYFIGKTIDDLVDIMNRNVIPLLYEYFFDNGKKVEAQLKEITNGMDVKIVSSSTSRVRLEKKGNE